MNGRLSTVALLCLLATAGSAAGAQQLADNGGPPIISLSSGAGAQTDTTSVAAPGMLDLLQKVQDLKQRLESLQNQIEIQNHELHQLRAEQRDFFANVNTQLSNLQKAGAAPAPPPAAPNPEAAPGPDGSSSAAAPPVSADEGTAQYDHAFALLRASHYHRAISAFTAFLKGHPDSSQAGSAHYWKAETYYVLGQYRDALPEFRAVALHYPKSSKRPDSLYKIGYIENRLGLPARARATWTTLIRTYPHTPAAKLAQRHLRTLGE